MVVRIRPVRCYDGLKRLQQGKERCRPGNARKSAHPFTAQDGKWFAPGVPAVDEIDRPVDRGEDTRVRYGRDAFLQLFQGTVRFCPRYDHRVSPLESAYRLT